MIIGDRATVSPPQAGLTVAETVITGVYGKFPELLGFTGSFPNYWELLEVHRAALGAGVAIVPPPVMRRGEGGRDYRLQLPQRTRGRGPRWVLHQLQAMGR